MSDFFGDCLNAVLAKDLEMKQQLVSSLFQNFSQYQYPYQVTNVISIETPGRPEYPELISPLDVPKRRINSPNGLASLYHALAHIEFNAINLAVDACYRFQHMPQEFYADWLSVANDELYHFRLLNEHLQSLNSYYGAFTAHNGLWDMVLKTEHDPMIRMALVPRVLEARGIDAIPDIINKVSHIKDHKGVEILKIIAHDEIRHVQIGNKWFKTLCNERNLDPIPTFFNLLEEYDAPKIRGAFNREGRKNAGFSDYELDLLLDRK